MILTLIKMALRGIGCVLGLAFAASFGQAISILFIPFGLVCIGLWSIGWVVEVCWASELANSRHPRLRFAVYFFVVLGALALFLICLSRY